MWWRLRTFYTMRPRMIQLWPKGPLWHWGARPEDILSPLWRGAERMEPPLCTGTIKYLQDVRCKLFEDYCSSSLNWSGDFLKGKSSYNIVLLGPIFDPTEETRLILRAGESVNNMRIFPPLFLYLLNYLSEVTSSIASKKLLTSSYYNCVIVLNTFDTLLYQFFKLFMITR